jgi:hypothetical protein
MGFTKAPSLEQFLEVEAPMRSSADPIYPYSYEFHKASYLWSPAISISRLKSFYFICHPTDKTSCKFIIAFSLRRT